MRHPYPFNYVEVCATDTGTSNANDHIIRFLDFWIFHIF